MVICLERNAELHMAQLIPLPLTVSCFCKIRIGFTFPVPAQADSPGQRAVKRVCVCVFVFQKPFFCVEMTGKTYDTCCTICALLLQSKYSQQSTSTVLLHRPALCQQTAHSKTREYVSSTSLRGSCAMPPDNSDKHTNNVLSSAVMAKPQLKAHAHTQIFPGKTFLIIQPDLKFPFYSNPKSLESKRQIKFQIFYENN